MSSDGIQSIQIHFNSLYANSFNNGLTSDCNFYLNDCIEVPVQHNIYISVINANIPFSFYSIDKYNNILTYVVNGITTSLSIVAGNYNAIQLASYFNSYLSTGFTCTYNAITNKFTFSHSTYDFYFTNASSCLKMIGFSTSLLSLNKALTSSFCVNLQTKQCICLLSNMTTGNISFCSMKSPNVLCSIPVATQPNSNIVYVNQYSFRSNLFSNLINYINLRLVDQDMKALDLNSIHWTCTIQLDIVKFV
jgi:hypothetical protein